METESTKNLRLSEVDFLVALHSATVLPEMLAMLRASDEKWRAAHPVRRHFVKIEAWWWQKKCRIKWLSDLDSWWFRYRLLRARRRGLKNKLR